MVQELIGQISSEGDTAIVTFGRSSISNVEDISIASEQVARFIDANRPKWVIFDFSGVKFFSSRVLGMLLETRANVTSWGGQVLISTINPQLHRVFKITNLDQVFEFYPDVKSAIDASQAGSSKESD